MYGKAYIKMQLKFLGTVSSKMLLLRIIRKTKKFNKKYSKKCKHCEIKRLIWTLNEIKEIILLKRKLDILKFKALLKDSLYI